MSKPETRWRCVHCSAVTPDSGLLVATSPFDPDDTLTGCPKCKQCNEGFDEMCDEPGCGDAASCGWPSSGGYRRTCYAHMKKEDGGVVSAHTPVDALDPGWYKPGSYKNPVGVHEEQATLTPEDSCPQKTPEDAAVGPSGPVPTTSMGAARAVQVADIQRPQALTQASALPGSPPR